MPPEHTGEQAAGLAALGRRLDGIETMLERVWGDLDFIRNRLSCYIGDGIALTYLLDQTPMFVNCNDFGCPVNLIDGGRYEEENLEVLLSFVTPDTVFVDVGANVGFYTVEIARRLTGNGRAYAFEPHPKLIELLRRNAFVNGLAPVVSSFSFALSDRNGPADLQYPTGHLGGGQVSAPGEIAGHTMVKSELKKLDDLLGRDFRCDLVKIDVEGHELNVLNGMREIVGNSPRIKILFEKLVPNIGNEAEPRAILRGARLCPLCGRPRRFAQRARGRRFARLGRLCAGGAARADRRRRAKPVALLDLSPGNCGAVRHSLRPRRHHPMGITARPPRAPSCFTARTGFSSAAGGGSSCTAGFAAP